MLSNDAEKLLKEMLAMEIPEEMKHYVPKRGLTDSIVKQQTSFTDIIKIKDALSLLISDECITRTKGGLIIITAKGKAYFEVKKRNKRVWYAEHWIAPFMTGFLSGVLATLLGTALVMYFLHHR